MSVFVARDFGRRATARRAAAPTGCEEKKPSSAVKLGLRTTPTKDKPHPPQPPPKQDAESTWKKTRRRTTEQHVNSEFRYEPL
jgi:hypothetical protein